MGVIGLLLIIIFGGMLILILMSKLCSPKHSYEPMSISEIRAGMSKEEQEFHKEMDIVLGNRGELP